MYPPDVHPIMYSMVYMTAGSLEEAKRIVKALVEARLVACGNILPVESIYTWQGELVEESEVVVIMKTRKELVHQALEEIHRLHSYDLPCAVAYPMETGLPSYLEWIEEVTAS